MIFGEAILRYRVMLMGDPISYGTEALIVNNMRIVSVQKIVKFP